MGKIIDLKINNNSFYNVVKDDYYFRKLVNTIDTYKCNKLSDDITDEFDKLKEKVKYIVPNKDFSNRLLSRIDLIKNYSDKEEMIIKDNLAIGYINNNDYLFVAIKDNKIEYSTENDEESSFGKIVFNNDKYFVKYRDVLCTELVDAFSKKKSITNKIIDNINLYNYNGIELAKKSRIKTNNKKIEIDKYTRVNNNILRCYKVNYLNKNNIIDGKFVIDKATVNKEEYYIGFNYSTGNNIPNDIYYQDIDYDIYNEIKCKKR